jgi:hypothetical protein
MSAPYLRAAAEQRADRDNRLAQLRYQRLPSLSMESLGNRCCPGAQPEDEPTTGRALQLARSECERGWTAAPHGQDPADQSNAVGPPGQSGQHDGRVQRHRLSDANRIDPVLGQNRAALDHVDPILERGERDSYRHDHAFLPTCRRSSLATSHPAMAAGLTVPPEAPMPPARRVW